MEPTNDNAKINVIVRIRPTLENENLTNFVEIMDENTIKLKRPGNALQMKFSTILNQKSNQEEAFQTVEKAIYDMLEEKNSTIFAYGQTGSGKTFTIIGDPNQTKGILLKSLELLMQKKKKIWTLEASFFEIYNEKIYDLFARKKNIPLNIRENKNLELQIPDLTSIEIKSAPDGLCTFELALKHRSIAPTQCNINSSRSHSIFQFTFKSLNKVISTLRIVDLAGSEKYDSYNPVSKDVQLSELNSINSSLSNLGQCIAALGNKKRTHIPYRNSKLTRILSDSMTGKSKIWLIICISPSISSYAETLSTLNFANSAKRAILDGREVKKNKLEATILASEEINIFKEAYEKEKSLRLKYEQIINSSFFKKDEFGIPSEIPKDEIKEIPFGSELIQQNEKKKFNRKTSMHNINILNLNHEKNLIFQKIEKAPLQTFDSNNPAYVPKLIKTESPTRKGILDENKIKNHTGMSLSPSRNYLLEKENKKNSLEGDESRFDADNQNNILDNDQNNKSIASNSVHYKYLGNQTNYLDYSDSEPSKILNNHYQNTDKNIQYNFYPDQKSYKNNYIKKIPKQHNFMNKPENGLSITPSRSYLLEKENNFDGKELSDNSSIIFKADNLKSELSMALSQLQYLQDKDREIDGLIY